MDEFNVGDKVIVVRCKDSSLTASQRIGYEGEIIRVDESNIYPIVVQFSDGISCCFYPSELSHLKCEMFSQSQLDELYEESIPNTMG